MINVNTQKVNIYIYLRKEKKEKKTFKDILHLQLENKLTKHYDKKGRLTRERYPSIKELFSNNLQRDHNQCVMWTCKQ